MLVLTKGSKELNISIFLLEVKKKIHALTHENAICFKQQRKASKCFDFASEVYFKKKTFNIDRKSISYLSCIIRFHF